MFETTTCSRCKGTGKYSFCSDYRDVCFKCKGKKEVLTKRGLLAYKYYENLCQIQVSELKPGDVILANGVTFSGKSFSYKAKVLEVSRESDQGKVTHGKTVNGKTEVETWIPLRVTYVSDKFGKSSFSSKGEHKVRIFRSDDHERKFKAIQYQNMMTKTGSIKKEFKEVL